MKTTFEPACNDSSSTVYAENDKTKWNVGKIQKTIDNFVFLQTIPFILTDEVQEAITAKLKDLKKTLLVFVESGKDKYGKMIYKIRRNDFTLGQLYFNAGSSKYIFNAGYVDGKFEEFHLKQIVNKLEELNHPQ